jgi:hypothetical protein
MRKRHSRSATRAFIIRFALFAIAPLWLGVACASSPASPETELEPEPENALRVLFIGNSLTYFNNLPGVLAALADSAGVERPLFVGQVAAPDFSLEDHWNDGTARAALDARAWDVVILQQGPSSLPQNALHLASWSRRWADEIRRVGARPALYMVWPQRSRFDDFAAASASYSNAAREAEGILMPVGEAWREAFRQDPNSPLYHADGLHPSPYGTYLAAVVMLAVLYDVEEVGLTPSLRTKAGATMQIPAAAALSLQRAATHANENFAIR